MKNFMKKAALILLLLLLSLFSYFVFGNANLIAFGPSGKRIVTFVFAALIIVNILYIIYYYNSSYKIKEIRYKSKLLNSLIENSDTIYLLYRTGDSNPIYITKNVNDVLNIIGDEDISKSQEIINKIFETPIIKEELRKWDGDTEFVSQMFSDRKSVV